MSIVSVEQTSDGALPIPQTSWPMSAPSEDEQHVASIVCGNSHLHWAFHNGCKADFKPALFWRTPHLKPCDLEFEMAHALSRHLPQFAHNFVFGSGNFANHLTANSETLRRPVISVYIVSCVAEQSSLLHQMWSGVPSRVFLMTGDDFFTKSEGRYDSMGFDRLAALRGASSLYGFPALVFDGGTATTYTAADCDGTVMGGGIAPGFRTKFQSLKDYTDALPFINPEEVLKRVRDAVKKKEAFQTFARDTKEAMMVDVLSEFALKTRWVIRKWLSVVGQNDRENDRDRPNDRHPHPQPTPKVNSKRVVLVCGGDGEILTHLLSPGAAGVLDKNFSLNFLNDAIQHCNIIHQKHLAHYGIAEVLCKNIIRKNPKPKQETHDAILTTNAHDHHHQLTADDANLQTYVGQRVAKTFLQPDQDGDFLYRGTIIDFNKAKATKNDERKTGDKGSESDDDFFYIKYDDGDAEHVSVLDLKEMLQLFKVHGEKKKSITTTSSPPTRTKKSPGRPRKKDTQLNTLYNKKASLPSSTSLTNKTTHVTNSITTTTSPPSSTNTTTPKRRGRPPKNAKQTPQVDSTATTTTPSPNTSTSTPTNGPGRKRKSPPPPLNNNTVPEKSSPSTAPRSSGKKRGRARKSNNETNPQQYITFRVAKRFDKEVFFGTITHYDTDERYWAVVYDDDDKEDFDEKDLFKAFKLYDKYKQNDPNPNKQQQFSINKNDNALDPNANNNVNNTTNANATLSPTVTTTTPTNTHKQSITDTTHSSESPPATDQASGLPPPNDKNSPVPTTPTMTRPPIVPQVFQKTKELSSPLTQTTVVIPPSATSEETTMTMASLPPMEFVEEQTISTDGTRMTAMDDSGNLLV